MTDPTKEDREAAEAWVRNMCWFGSATDVAGRGREAYAHGRASMRARRQPQWDEMREEYDDAPAGGDTRAYLFEWACEVGEFLQESREKTEKQLAQARELLRRCHAGLPRDTSLTKAIHAHLESEGNE